MNQNEAAHVGDIKGFSSRAPRIDSGRLRRLMDGVNAFGRNEATGGFNRTGFSDADMAVRDWFQAEMAADGLSVWRDGVANLFGRYGPGTGPVIMAGSHLDTVPEGGAYDGALGVCVALECVRAMKDAGFVPDTAIEVVATSEEEGRFGGMLGSQTIAGKVTREWLENARDANGVALADAMQKQGLDAREALRGARDPATVRCFLELHVEQGPVLDGRNIQIGIADAISGVCNLHVSFIGTANHSGTTPMDMRADAFMGLARFAGEIEAIIAANGTKDSRITIGKVDLSPNFPHTVPGKAECTVNIRDTDPSAQERLTGRVEEAARNAARNAGLKIEIAQISWLDPVRLDEGLLSLLREEADALGYGNVVMASGAGHDAQTMQSLCASGLIFVPSIGGISHSPEELTRWEDIEKGAQLMLNALARLAKH
ncbi:MAG: Zn-dependent hydrolase [Notoacmeibacter sp.]|nr:Zn-dependent hydrolase [Notoacmeibacter sp.]